MSIDYQRGFDEGQHYAVEWILEDLKRVAKQQFNAALERYIKSLKDGQVTETRRNSETDANGVERISPGN